VQIRNGSEERNEVRLEGDVLGEAIAIGLSEGDPQSNTRWLILVFVQTTQGEFFLGGVTTNTAATDGNPSRIVAFASCPGAIGWVVRARNAFPSANQAVFDGELWVIPGKCCGGMGPFGVTNPPQPPGSGGGENGGGSGGGFNIPVPPV